MFRFDLILSNNPWLQFASLAGFFIVALVYLTNKRSKLNAFQKPFVKDSRRTREPLECDPKKRALRLEQHFSLSALPDVIDAIVIGSGVGGLATAAILAKTGRKVVVLEQHSKTGGCCQTFTAAENDGYEWDIGIHYVGNMGSNDFERFYLDQLTEGQLDWKQLAEDFDNVVLVKSAAEVTAIPMWGNRERLLDDLIKRYPKHENGLREFFALMLPLTSSQFCYFPILKVIPVWLANFIIKLRLYKLLHVFANFHDTTLKSWLNRLFGEGEYELKAVLGYCFGDCGVEPSRTGSGMLTGTFNYYDGAAYYPVGGASEIPYSIIPTIEKAGGRVFVNANVTEILLSDGKKAIGVRVGTSSGPVDIKAPIVISDAGVSNTFRKLLPKDVAKGTKIWQLLESGRIHPSMAMFQVFVGLKGSQGELNLPANNLWLLYEPDIDKAISEWCRLDFEIAAKKGKLPFLFVAFPSAKDPTYNKRHPGRSVCTMITIAPFEWLKKWQNDPVVKMVLANRCWNYALDLYPQLAERKNFIEAGSPLYNIDAFEGADPYGLENNSERFSPEVVAALRPKVGEIENLYLTGQDVLTCGFVTCLYSALMTCQTILQSLGECDDMVDDLKQLYLCEQKIKPSKNVNKK